MTVLGICLLAAIGVCALGGVPAETGRAFADIYNAFAPFGVLHRAYADYLFYGTEPEIPAGLTEVCPEVGTSLGLLQVDLTIQTDSYVAESVSQLVRFRTRWAGFCDAYGGWLADIDAMELPHLDRLKEASAAGLFSGIYDLQQELQSVFEGVLGDLDSGQDQWSFGVAFSLRALLTQTGWTTIGDDLRGILYGSEDAASPPAFVDADLAEAIEALMAYVGTPLDDTAARAARELAQTVYDAVIAGP